MHSSTLVCDRNNSARCGLVPKYALVLSDPANFRIVGNPAEIETTIKECYAESDSSIWPPACGGSLNLRRRVLTN